MISRIASTPIDFFSFGDTIWTSGEKRPNILRQDAHFPHGSGLSASFRFSQARARRSFYPIRRLPRICRHGTASPRRCARRAKSSTFRCPTEEEIYFSLPSVPFREPCFCPHGIIISNNRRNVKRQYIFEGQIRIFLLLAHQTRGKYENRTTM